MLQIFRGPINSKTPTKQLFQVPFEAKAVRIYPETWHKDRALQLDIIGCSEYPLSTTSIGFSSEHTILSTGTTSIGTVVTVASEKVSTGTTAATVGITTSATEEAKTATEVEETVGTTLIGTVGFGKTTKGTTEKEIVTEGVSTTPGKVVVGKITAETVTKGTTVKTITLPQEFPGGTTAKTIVTKVTEHLTVTPTIPVI